MKQPRKYSSQTSHFSQPCDKAQALNLTTERLYCYYIPDHIRLHGKQYLRDTPKRLLTLRLLSRGWVQTLKPGVDRLASTLGCSHLLQRSASAYQMAASSQSSSAVTAVGELANRAIPLLLGEG